MFVFLFYRTVCLLARRLLYLSQSNAIVSPLQLLYFASLTCFLLGRSKEVRSVDNWNVLYRVLYSTSTNRKKIAKFIVCRTSSSDLSFWTCLGPITSINQENAPRSKPLLFRKTPDSISLGWVLQLPSPSGTGTVPLNGSCPGNGTKDASCCCQVECPQWHPW